MYQIIGTVNHYGLSANAAIYNKENDMFYLCDDETTYEIGSLDVDGLPRKVYLIIYQRQ
jgi:hypothetical protein